MNARPNQPMERTPPCCALRRHSAARYVQEMRPSVVAKFYGLWLITCLLGLLAGNFYTGHGEWGISIHLVLIATGLPLSLLSLQVVPNGTLFSSGVAGILGLLQWWAIAEASRREADCRQRKIGPP